MFFLVLICTQCSNFEFLGIAIWTLHDKKVTYSWKSDFFIITLSIFIFVIKFFVYNILSIKITYPQKFYLHTYHILEFVSFFILGVFSNVTKGLLSRKQCLKLGHSWWKWSKLGHFGGQNDVIGQIFGVGRKKFFLKTFLKVI